MDHVELETQRITVQGKDLNYALAKYLAEGLASSRVAAPMLVAWFDGKK